MDARRGVMFLTGVVLVAIWSSLSPTCRAAERVMVVYGNPPGRDLTLYDVQATRFEDEALEGFVEALADAQLLYVGQYTGDAAATNIFGVPERAEVVKALLARGGVLVVDYNALSGGACVKFFAEVGLKHPGSTEGEYYDAVVAPGAKHPVLTEPHGISGEIGSAFGWWTNWGESYTCLACKKGEPDKAALRVHFLGQTGRRYITAKCAKVDLPPIRYLFAEEEKKDGASEFITLWEPYEGKPFIEKVERLPVEE